MITDPAYSGLLCIWIIQTEAATRSALWKKMFLEISQNSEENTCARISFLKACNFIKKETLAQVFLCEFCKILRTPFLTEHLWWLLLDEEMKVQS